MGNRSFVCAKFWDQAIRCELACAHYTKIIFLTKTYYARRVVARTHVIVLVPPPHRLPKGHLRHLLSKDERLTPKNDRVTLVPVRDVAQERPPSSIFARNRPPRVAARRCFSPRPSSRSCPPRQLGRKPHGPIPERHEARHGHEDDRYVAHDQAAPARGAGGGGRCRDQIGPRQGHRRRGALNSAHFLGTRAPFDPRSRPGARCPP